MRFVERDAAIDRRTRCCSSAVANAANNDELDPEELYVSACYVDEGPTTKRWRPRARGRATRIRKRTSHITVIVSRLPEERLAGCRPAGGPRTWPAGPPGRATRRARAESAEGPEPDGSAGTPKRLPGSRGRADCRRRALATEPRSTGEPTSAEEALRRRGGHERGERRRPSEAAASAARGRGGREPRRRPVDRASSRGRSPRPEASRRTAGARGGAEAEV